VSSVPQVLVLDWSALSKPTVESLAPLFYPSARQNVLRVAQRLTQLLMYTLQRRILFLAQIHIIGFSLGAHVAGRTGYLCAHHSGYMIGRISGR